MKPIVLQNCPALRNLASCALAGALIFGTTACDRTRDYSLTGRLWGTEYLGRYYEPAPNPRLQLFYDQRRHDVLVAYDEEHTNRKSVRRRAYFADQNRSRINDARKPRFVDPKRAVGLTAIPLLESPRSGSFSNTISFWAVVSTNGQEFAFSGRQGDAYRLPVYADQSGLGLLTGRVLLTPFAVAADVAVVALVVAAVGAAIYGISQGAYHN